MCLIALGSCMPRECLTVLLSVAVAVLLACGPLAAQPFSAPCTAPDSIVERYQDDADRLALSRTFRNGSNWMDSVAIDTAWSRTAMNALLAVYNSSSPARDTVVDLLDIHVFPVVRLRMFYVVADPALPWMQQFQLGNNTTGTPAIDELLSTYGIALTNYHDWAWLGGPHMAVLGTNANVNLLALSALFAAQPGVAYAEPDNGCCDGNTITDSVHTDHVNLVYSRGWGDCPSGCTARRFWEFNVFPDCSVQYVGSYGSPLPQPTSVPLHLLPAVRLYPNPSSDFIRFDGVAPGQPALLYSAQGALIQQFTVDAGHLDIRQLPAGVYWIRFTDDPAVAPVPFVKE